MTQLSCGGRGVSDPVDLVRRYCGLSWSGGEPEVWAWRYFDEIPDLEPFRVIPVDVVAAGSLHSGLRRSDLAFFAECVSALTRWLEAIPPELQLGSAEADSMASLARLPEQFPSSSLSLLTKVLHRKRPGFVPMLDRALQERYRAPGGRRGEAMWPDLIEAVRADLADHDNQVVFAEIAANLALSTLTRIPTNLRILDISVWMQARS